MKYGNVFYTVSASLENLQLVLRWSWMISSGRGASPVTDSEWRIGMTGRLSVWSVGITGRCSNEEGVSIGYFAYLYPY